jgi:ATP-binding cassette subfamily D (ALD) long-chain fatty acid import protein
VLEGRGQVIEAEEIRFDKVPLISPNGDVLVKSMSFNVEPGVRSRTVRRLISRNTCLLSDPMAVSRPGQLSGQG